MYTEYKIAENLSLSWDKNKPLMVISFVDSECTTCRDFDDLVIPEIQQAGIQHFSVNVRDNKIPFPPMMLPTSFWFFDDSRPPLIKRGTPPQKQMLVELIEKAKKVYEGDSTSEKEFS